MEEPVRKCTACGVEYPESKFKRRGGRQSHTRHTMCNRCLYVRYTRPNAQRNTQVVQDYKVQAGCADCGFNKHPAALEFDHRPGVDKKFNVMEKVGSYSMTKVWDEIAKCDVVCANCHAIRTTERRVLVE
jgi:hypothetical protein